MNKVVIVLFVAIAVAISKPLSDEDHEKLHKLNLECAKTSGVDEETLKKIEEDVEYPETDEMKEHAKCFMTGLGVMDDEGKIDAEVMATSLKMVVSDGQATGIAEKCNVEKDSAKETAWEMGRCVQTELHALGV